MISRTVLVFCMLLCTGSGSAQVPQTMGYQGLLTDGAGVVVADASYSVTFKIYDMLTGGSLLWTEVHATVSTVNGVFNVILGSMTPLTIAFDKTLYLEITVGANVLTPRIELTGSPYALNARGIVTDASGNVGIGTVSPGTPLAIRGNGGINDVGITQNQVGTASTMELTTRDVAGSQATRILMRGFADAADIEFYRGARGSETLSMHIEGDNGRVGIGTSAPAKELHLTGTSAGIRIEAGGTSNSTVQFYDGGTQAGQAGWHEADGVFKIVAGTDFAADHFTIDGSGNVGIGTTAPKDELHVEGDITLPNQGSAGDALVGRYG